ncbi:hypothetical protein AKJ16_DCAP02320 [Drosera capensis]
MFHPIYERLVPRDRRTIRRKMMKFEEIGNSRFLLECNQRKPHQACHVHHVGALEAGCDWGRQPDQASRARSFSGHKHGPKSSGFQNALHFID